VAVGGPRSAARAAHGGCVVTAIAGAEVFFAVLFAWLLLGQLPSCTEFTGGAFMLAGVILVRIDETKRSAPT
jgi:drug/metabolite transporter (DMT)-like permease